MGFPYSSPSARDIPAHTYIEFTRLQFIFLLLQSLLCFLLCFSPHIFFSFHPKLCSIFNHLQTIPSVPNQARHPLLEARGTFLFLWPATSSGIAWPGSFYQLLVCLQSGRDSVRCQGISLFVPPAVYFYTFDPMIFSHTHAHTHTYINLLLIHCSSELFCSLQIPFHSLFHLLLLRRDQCRSQER